MKPIYLDYGATSPVRPEVMEILLPFFQKEYANAGSIHDFGQRSRDAIELARKQVADSLGASSPRKSSLPEAAPKPITWPSWERPENTGTGEIM